MVYSRLLSLLIIVTTTSLYGNTDVIIFSRKRPLQLECLINSIERYCTGITSITVLVKDDGTQWRAAYNTIVKQHQQCQITWQKNQVEFRPLLLDLIKACKSNHILFLVDDDVFISPVDIRACINQLEQEGAWCFSLRMGQHITYCFTQDLASPPPPLQYITPTIRSFTFDFSSSDWGYPNTVDATIYRKQDALDAFLEINFSNPNQLEARWSKKPPKTRLGLCFVEAPVINVPINLVQDGVNRITTYYSVEQLFDLFIVGNAMRYDCKPGFNRSPHVNLQPTFIKKPLFSNE